MQEDNKSAFKMLLFTNRDSDNIGDKVIEACDIALLKTIMRNLKEEHYEIQSYDAAIIFKAETEELIKNCDIVIVGGAPMFNYKYQNFYERTIITVEWAKKYGKSVVFSAVGIETYDEDNEKCQRLKRALNEDCVKMITTRDGYDLLKQYKENDKLIIGKVSDPAVFTKQVFRNYIPQKRNHKKKIGIFVLRAYGFKANGIDFDRIASARLWSGLANELEKRGYDYEFLTSGHFADEAFLEFLIQKYGIPVDKCTVNMDTPEKLVDKIASFDAVVSCRLHPSIISFSLGIPSLGIIWNPKVSKFYESIGYENRSISVDDVTPSALADALGQAMEEGVKIESDYLMSVYRSLFEVIKDSLNHDSEVMPYSYSELEKDLVRYSGTENQEWEENLIRKFRRIYKKYNKINTGYNIIYNSGFKSEQITTDYDSEEGEIKRLETGTVEFWEGKLQKNNGSAQLLENHFMRPEYYFVGWYIRVKADNGSWYWYLEDDSIMSTDEYSVKNNGLRKKTFANKEIIPFIPVKYFERMVAEAVWRKLPKFTVLYHCGAKPEAGAKKFREMKYKYNKQDGEVKLLPSLAYEFHSNRIITNGDAVCLLKNQYLYKKHEFVGWRMRVRVGKQWFWYLEDKSLFLKDNYRAQKNLAKIKVFEDEEEIPYIPNDRIDAVVVEAVWREK